MQPEQTISLYRLEGPEERECRAFVEWIDAYTIKINRQTIELTGFLHDGKLLPLYRRGADLLFIDIFLSAQNPAPFTGGKSALLERL